MSLPPTFRLTLLVTAVAIGTVLLVFIAGCRNPSPTVAPEPTSTFVPASPTPRTAQASSSYSNEIDLVSRGALVFESSICVTCHAIEGTLAAGTIGPDLTNIASIAADRRSALTAEEYLRESIEDPSVFLAPECPGGISPCMALMPEGLKDILGPNYEAVIAYLLSLE